MERIDSFERTITKLAKLSRLTYHGSRLDQQGLVTAGEFLDVLASETTSRVDRLRKATTLNIHYLTSMNGLRDRILGACGMAHTLYNNSNKHNVYFSICEVPAQVKTKFLHR